MQVDGIIVARDDPAGWDPQRDRWLEFKSLQTFRLTGYGVLDGRGDQWWALSCKVYFSEDCREKSPTSLVISGSSKFEISYLTLKDSQQIHLSIENSANVYAIGLQVVAPSNSPNTDGIHIVRSENIYIQNCFIATGDDCISIQSGSYNIYIETTTCGPGHGISIGSLGKDNTWACVAGVYVNDVIINEAMNGLRIKTWQGGLGGVHDVYFEDVLMNNVANPIIIDQFYCDSLTPCQNQSDGVEINDIHYRNIKGTSATSTSVSISCSENFPCHNIYLEETVELTLSKSDDDEFTSLPLRFCWNAFGQDAEGCLLQEYLIHELPRC